MTKRFVFFDPSDPDAYDAEMDRTRRLTSRPQVRMRLNHRLSLYALRCISAALDADDVECVAILEYALYGSSSTTLTMSELSDRFVRLQQIARREKDKKMQLVLKAAAANAAG